MAITHIQTVKGENGGGVATASITGVAVGNLLVVDVMNSTANPVTSLTDNASGGTNSYATGVSKISDHGDDIQQFYCVVPGGKGGNLTLSANGTSNCVMFVHEFNSSFGWPATPIDRTASNIQASPGTGADAVTSGSTATRTKPNEVLCGAVVNDTNAQTWTQGTGWTIPTNGSEGNFSFVTCASEYKIVTVAGTDAATFQLSGNGACITILGTYKDNSVVQGAAHIFCYPGQT